MDHYSEYEVNLFEQQYERIESLGSGAFAEVHLCRNVIDKQMYAVKVIRITDAKTEISLLECETMALLDHPNVARYHQAWIEEGVPSFLETLVAKIKEVEIQSDSSGSSGSYKEPTRTLFISMKMYSGGALIDQIGKLSSENILKIFRGLLSALEYLNNKSIVHGDIKPHNILLDEELNPKLADFGSSFVVGGSFGVKYGGTLGYIPLGEEKPPSYATDVHSFGITMLQLISALPELNSEFEALKQKIKDGAEVPHLLETHEDVMLTVLGILRAPSPPSIAELLQHCMETEGT